MTDAMEQMRRSIAALGAAFVPYARAQAQLARNLRAYAKAASRPVERAPEVVWWYVP